MKGPMKDDYLWDRSGEPDPEIQKLETVLAKFRHVGEAPVFPQITDSARKSSLPLILRVPRLAFAAAAILILTMAVFGFLSLRPKQTPGMSSGWDVAHLAGAPRVGSHRIGKNGEPAGLRIGETLETDSESRAIITASTFGEINVEPNTRLRLLRTTPGRQHMALERGTIHATIWAPPGDFVVDTPSARAIDLGCVYTLAVDDSGAGLLRTTIGWVGFKLAEHESFIPAGAVCATRPKIGPGTPYFEDAPESVRVALSSFDFDPTTPEKRAALLDAILKQARPQDALTLWHLLARVDGSERDRVYDRLAAFVPPPQGVTREGISRLDQHMLDSWWTELGYGDASLWRSWERSWSQTEAYRK